MYRFAALSALLCTKFRTLEEQQANLMINSLQLHIFPALKLRKFAYAIYLNRRIHLSFRFLLYLNCNFYRKEARCATQNEHVAIW